LLRRATSDNELADAILKNYKTAPISPREMVMLDYAAQLTEDATKITPETHETLRSVGFDDTAILQITLGKTQFDNSFVFNNGIFQLLIRIEVLARDLKVRK
jgi:alkylhydroperoxidase family enzyme